MTGMNILALQEAGHTVVNPLPFPEWVFFAITFVILMAALAGIHLIGKTRPHS
jgi:hypothetical protein